MSELFDKLNESIAKLEASIARGHQMAPEVEQRILRERTDRMAREPATGEVSTQKQNLTVLAFERAGRRYAVRLDGLYDVTALEQVAAVPGLPSSYLGVTARRGKVVAVVDLPALFTPGTTPTTAPSWLLMAAGAEIACGVAADAIHDIGEVKSASIGRSMPTFPALVQRYTVGVLEDRTVIVDLPGLLRDQALRVEDRDG